MNHGTGIAEAFEARAKKYTMGSAVFGVAILAEH